MLGIFKLTILVTEQNSTHRSVSSAGGFRERGPGRSWCREIGDLGPRRPASQRQPRAQPFSTHSWLSLSAGLLHRLSLLSLSPSRVSRDSFFAISGPSLSLHGETRTGRRAPGDLREQLAESSRRTFPRRETPAPVTGVGGGRAGSSMGRKENSEASVLAPLAVSTELFAGESSSDQWSIGTITTMFIFLLSRAHARIMCLSVLYDTYRTQSAYTLASPHECTWSSSLLFFFFCSAAGVFIAFDVAFLRSCPRHRWRCSRRGVRVCTYLCVHGRISPGEREG